MRDNNSETGSWESRLLNFSRLLPKSSRRDSNGLIRCSNPPPNVFVFDGHVQVAQSDQNSTSADLNPEQVAGLLETTNTEYGLSTTAGNEISRDIRLVRSEYGNSITETNDTGQGPFTHLLPAGSSPVLLEFEFVPFPGHTCNSP
jgi:hypothetical protein